MTKGTEALVWNQLQSTEEEVGYLDLVSGFGRWQWIELTEIGCSVDELYQYLDMDSLLFSGPSGPFNSLQYNSPWCSSR